MSIKKLNLSLALFSGFFFQPCFAQQDNNIATISGSTNTAAIHHIIDHNTKTFWKISPKDLTSDQQLLLTLKNSGDVKRITINAIDLDMKELEKLLELYITYDPMNPGNPIPYKVSKQSDGYQLSFDPVYGAHVKLVLKGRKLTQSLQINEISVALDAKQNAATGIVDKSYLNPNLPIEERVKKLLAVMTPAQKIDLLREGWGIPGIPSLGIPSVMKVEAIHGFSYGSGATIFPQSIAMGATWNKKLIEHAAIAIADETKAANAFQAWSPVLDVAQDPRWGRCEETYGEDPVLVSQIGGAWIKGFQSRGLITTPKHFAAHGAPLGGRDSHDIGISEREMREIHLVPFRDIFKKYRYESLMMSYNDFLGVPVGKSKTLLNDILREEWGFDGFIVSDCGAISNMTSKKHYTALDKVEAASDALSVNIATNCGDTYNDPKVIEAVVNGQISPKDLDNTCATLLRVMFRNGLFEHNPSQKLDWKKVYPGWNSPEHQQLARQVARESIVLLENKNNLLPLSKDIRDIAVIGPGADDLQPGDYSPELKPGQLKSVLQGIQKAVSQKTRVHYEKGCDFFSKEHSTIQKAVELAKQSDIAILVLGDQSTSEAISGIQKTSGENHDIATLELQGDQQRLLEAVVATGKPVVLILQSGRPYNVSFASAHCASVLVNWLPGQEGGPATADILFGDYNPAGRLPMTFPKHVGQLPLYYNFKTSGRRYEYSDMEFYPLYRFGYGLSYTTFKYANLIAAPQTNGNIDVSVEVSNTGRTAGDEVVQLYLSDIFASVKTRVMELKDFDRIHLDPGQTKQVRFTLTPYDLSLLNDKMDRVVESGDFKIMVGGASPTFEAKDQIKDHLGYQQDTQGLSTTVKYAQNFAANFQFKVLEAVPSTGNTPFTIAVEVSNSGNLTDAGKLALFVDENKTDEKSFELDPQGKKIISFEIEQPTFKKLQFVGKYKTQTYTN